MRTSRQLLTTNYVITEQDQDGFYYAEWSHLKKYLSRAELIALIKRMKQGERHITLSNPKIYQIVFV